MGNDMGTIEKGVEMAWENERKGCKGGKQGRNETEEETNKLEIQRFRNNFEFSICAV